MKSKIKDYYKLSDKEKREFIFATIGMSMIMFKVIKWLKDKN